MMRQPRISAISPVERPLHLQVTWVDRSRAIIDLTELIKDLAVFTPLEDPAIFGKVVVGEWGWSVRWSDEIDLGADTLWRLSLEQSGEAMSPKAFSEWRRRNRLSLTAAGAALGLGKRMLVYYEQGQKIIPKTVLLATIGYEAQLGKVPGITDSGILRFVEEARIKASQPPIAIAANDLQGEATSAEVTELMKYRTRFGHGS